MKNLIKFGLTICLFFSANALHAQIKNSKTETVKILGNCGMCKTNIEKAGNVKKTANVEWDRSTHMATITYNGEKTNMDEILKRIALAGYDSDQFLAPDAVYADLPGCCQYDRENKVVSNMEMKSEDHGNHHSENKEAIQNKEVNKLSAVFDAYFSLKDALVQTNGSNASTQADKLLKALNSIEMKELTSKEHDVWMKINKDLLFDAEHIEDTKDVEHQRAHFMTLSENMHQLMQVSSVETTVYFQHCPMANEGKGANWLSKESAVKNPYYGNKMLSCGKTIETINK